MNPDWHTNVNVNVAFILEHVLVAQDEPQVITALDHQNNRYLAVAVDDSDDGEIVRWVYALLSNLEFYALLSRAVTIRDVMASDSLYVVDRRVDGGVIENTWSAKTMPPDLRPRPGSLLPPSTCARFPIAIAKPEMRIAGEPVRDNAISFNDLAQAMGTKQQLFHVLGSAIYRQANRRKPLPTATLHAVATGVGSFAITIRPDEELVFNGVVTAYRRLLEASADKAQLLALLTKLGPAVASAYATYVEFLRSRGLEVLTQSTKTAAYVGPKSTTRIAGYIGHLAQKRRRTDTGEEPRPETTAKFVGYFGGYLYYAKKFEFVADGNPQVFSGDIEDSLLTGLERGLAIGSQTKYEVEIRTVRVTEKSVTHVLLGFWLAPEPTGPTVPPTEPVKP